MTASSTNTAGCETAKRLRRARDTVKAFLERRFTSGKGLHPQTALLISDYAAAVGGKLYQAERKYEFGDNWRTDDWETQCKVELLRHVFKGDPLDVGAYAAFCWRRGWSTTPPGPTYAELKAQLSLAQTALERVRDADHRNTNTETAAEAFSYAHAVTGEALEAIAAVTEARS